MSEEAKWQDLSIELALNAKKNLDSKDDEITTLRQQLAKSEARVAELESIFIRQQGEYVKGPDGFDTWRDAAVSERTWRASMKPLNEAVDLARLGGA